MVGSALASRVQAHVERAKETGNIWRGHSFSCDNTDSVCPVSSPPRPLALAPCPLLLGLGQQSRVKVILGKAMTPKSRNFLDLWVVRCSLLNMMPP